ALVLTVGGGLTGMTLLWLRAADRGEHLARVRGEAERRRDEAEENAHHAREEQVRAEHQPDLSRGAQAQGLWGCSELGQARAVLDLCPPSSRDWEWHYLRRACSRCVLSARLGVPVTCVAISPDGRRVAACGPSSGIVSPLHPTEVTVWDSATGRVAFTR